MGSKGSAGRGARPLLVAALLAGALGLAACGGSGSEFGPAAEPAESPPTEAKPAGRVTYIGEGAEGIVFDPASGLVAVGLREPYRLGFVDPETLKLKERYLIPNPLRHLAVAPEGGLIAAPAESANRLFTIAPGKGIVDDIETGEHPHDAAFADGRIYVADEFGDTVTVVEDGELDETLPGPAQPGGIAAVEDRFIAVIAVSERVLQVYDTVNNGRLGKIPAGVGPTHIEALGDEVFVADTEGDMLRRFQVDADPRETGSVAAPGAPYGIAIDPGRQIVWVTLTATNQLAGYRINDDSMRRIATFPTIRQPNSVTVDPVTGNLFVVSRTTGQMQLISPRDRTRG